jgi:N-acyl homoserine lactone hydrolase
MLTFNDVRRVDLGYFIRPAEETGTGQPRVEPVLGYVVAHASGLLLFDTGLGEADAETEAHYRPRRRALPDALRQAGTDIGDVRWVVNCHLHFDHCGGNPALAGRPIVVQSTELASARQPDYTVAELVDFPGALYEEVQGEIELLPGVWIVPTPGHTAGHQSVVVRCGDGTVILAGQAHDTASAYAAELWAAEAQRVGTRDGLPSVSDWIERLQAFDPRRIVFAHDSSVVEPLSTRMDGDSP